MLHKTRGIVLKTTDYAESSVIVQVFTEKLGIQAYLVNGIKKPKAKISRNMLQPLHLLDMIVYHKNTTGLQRIAELKCAPVLTNIPYNVVKTSMVLFLNEVLYKAIKQQTDDSPLFDYVFNAVEWLDKQNETAITNFHLLFLTKLCRYLGFYPEASFDSSDDYFDLKEGQFKRYKPLHPLYIAPPLSMVFNTLLKTSFDDLHTLNISTAHRRQLITKLLDYYALHMEGFGNIHAHEVLEQVLA
jgi:DNA repair protein RecO (recombination protein O)